ncbi:MAG TPA: hypothetical protein DIT48_12150 [Actinobacteria bacterium]|nr:hypothetical protein [Actinomycetota bacterium]
MDLAEAAAVLGISAESVRARIHRARTLVRQRFGEAMSDLRTLLEDAASDLVRDGRSWHEGSTSRSDRPGAFDGSASSPGSSRPASPSPRAASGPAAPVRPSLCRRTVPSPSSGSPVRIRLRSLGTSTSCIPTARE